MQRHVLVLLLGSEHTSLDLIPSLPLMTLLAVVRLQDGVGPAIHIVVLGIAFQVTVLQMSMWSYKCEMHKMGTEKFIALTEAVRNENESVLALIMI
jgi:hypothetical protein